MKRYLITIEITASDVPDGLDIDLDGVLIEAARVDLNAEAVGVVSIEDAQEVGGDL